MRPTPQQKQTVLDTLNELRAFVEALPEDRSCGQCDHFDADKSYCGHWKTSVPADAQEAGCETWAQAIPF